MQRGVVVVGVWNTSRQMDLLAAQEMHKHTCPDIKNEGKLNLEYCHTNLF